MISKARETELVNAVRGKHAAEGVVAARRGNAKYSNYAIYILDNDQTVYVNLDKGTSHIQEHPNKKHIKKYRAAEERKASRAQEKADREQEKAERAAKPKAEPKAKAPAKPKAVRKPRAKKVQAAQAEPKKQQVVDPLAQATPVTEAK